jgi:cation diffusion facilitator CzcD-associated flavoprotein CzcO
MNQVAIIGAGPSGLAAARWLKREGFEPFLFEQGDTVGGQWSGDPRYSGVWPSLHTNTCREMTQFSDLPHEAGTPLYPSNQAMLAYLVRYAERFGLLARVRLRSRVIELARDAANGWALRWRDEAGVEHTDTYGHVVVASGRFTKPRWPQVPGLETFDGPCGATHTANYREPDRYVGRSVLVAGCAVSALEIAAELAVRGAARVVTANRRQRYIVQKIASGVPIEHLIQTRHAADMQQRNPLEAAAELKRVILATSGTPDAFGGLQPDADLRKAGVTQCQSFLPLVAEGRICAKPWIARVQGRQVVFADGTAEEFDGLIVGTGYDADLAFLSADLRQQLSRESEGLQLYKHTFHPDLPRLAFCGHFQLTGPYLPPIEAQARWIAYAWGGARPLPPSEIMRSAAGELGHQPDDKVHMPSLMMMLASEAGTVPDLQHWPELHDDLLHGPLTPVSFRLSGRDRMIDAAAMVQQTGRASSRLRRQLSIGT